MTSIMLLRPLKRSLNSCPGFRKAHEQMGLSLIELGDYKEGLAALAKGTGFIAFDNKGPGPSVL